MARGTVVAEFTDKYGNIRKLRQEGTRGAIKVAKNTDTVSHKLNRIAAVMIGARIKERRLVAGLTLDDLCTQAGLVSATPKNRMWEIENAIRQEGSRMGTLYAIASALHCEVGDLLPPVAEVRERAGVDFETTVARGLSVVA